MTLLPCPFCGGRSDVATVLPGGYKRYGCFDCGIRACNAEDWNRRTPPPATKAYLDWLRGPMPTGAEYARQRRNHDIAFEAEWPGPAKEES